jgi:hypothetical protein
VPLNFKEVPTNRVWTLEIHRLNDEINAAVLAKDLWRAGELIKQRRELEAIHRLNDEINAALLAKDLWRAGELIKQRHELEELA